MRIAVSRDLRWNSKSDNGLTDLLGSIGVDGQNLPKGARNIVSGCVLFSSKLSNAWTRRRLVRFGS
jgi:hypothetical protein